MNIYNELGNYRIYKNLTQHISQILDDENFRREMSLGKYSRWAVSLTAEQLIPMLSAIGEYGRYGSDIKDIPIEQQIRENLKEKRHEYFEFNHQQIPALSFLTNFFWCDSREKELIIKDYDWKHADFENNICWANSLTASDLLGVIWHAKGFFGRYSLLGHLDKEGVAIGIEISHRLLLEALNCLTRVAQGKQTYYRYGSIVPLPEFVTKK
jgi:hypothetical protein